MKDVITPVAGDTYAAADYLELQARARGVRPGSGPGSTNAFSGAQAKGEDAVVFCEHTATLAHHGNPILIDSAHNWQDRIIHVRGVVLPGTGSVPGHATDYLEHGQFQQFEASGYTGTGGLDAAGAAPVGGNPPDEGPVNGGAQTSYRVPLEALGVYLYADAVAGQGYLYAYNAEGVSVWLSLTVTGTSDLGGH